MLKFNIVESSWILKRRLVERFGEDCLKIFKNGLSSKPELEFLFVLRHYFGKNNVKSTVKIEKKFYDYMINHKLLIELDGDFWHGKKNNPIKDFKVDDKIKSDTEKNEIAKKLGYKLIRVNESESKSIKTLEMIERCLNEIQTNEN
jgi:very-short-patch-repair endonuclease